MNISSFTRFSATTGLKAFGFAINSRLPAERYFWFCLIACGSVLTILDIMCIIDSFITNSTGTKVILITNDSINLGEPTLCVDTKLPDFDVDKEEFQKELDSVNIKEIFEEPSNSSKLMNVVTRLVVDVTRAEQGILGKKATKNGTSVLPHLKYSSELFPILNAHLNTVNISLRAIAGLAGAHLCRKMRVKLHFYDYTGTDEISDKYNQDVCTQQLIVWLGITPQGYKNQMLCIKLPNRFFLFESSEDITTIKWYGAGFNVAVDKDTEEWGILDFSGGLVFTESSENLLTIPMYYGHFVGIYVMGQYSKINQRSSPCGSEPQSQCLLRCRFDYIRSNCGCTPLFDDEFAPNAPKCGTFNVSTSKSSFIPGFDYDNLACQKIKAKFQPDEQCQSTCVSLCDYTVLSFYYMQGKNTQYLGGTRVALFVDRFSYHKIVEIPLLTARQLMGSIGGSLSLYLGASFIVLIHVCVFWITELIERLYRRKFVTLSTSQSMSVEKTENFVKINCKF